MPDGDVLEDMIQEPQALRLGDTPTTTLEAGTLLDG